MSLWAEHKRQVRLVFSVTEAEDDEKSFLGDLVGKTTGEGYSLAFLRHKDRGIDWGKEKIAERNPESPLEFMAALIRSGLKLFLQTQHLDSQSARIIIAQVFFHWDRSLRPCYTSWVEKEDGYRFPLQSQSDEYKKSMKIFLRENQGHVTKKVCKSGSMAVFHGGVFHRGISGGSLHNRSSAFKSFFLFSPPEPSKEKIFSDNMETQVYAFSYMHGAPEWTDDEWMDTIAEAWELVANGQTCDAQLNSYIGGLKPSLGKKIGKGMKNRGFVPKTIYH